MTLPRDWPLFGIRIETPRLSLSYPADDDLEVVNTLVSQGIHDPAVMPFEVPWTDAPPDIRSRESLQFWWGLRANWRPSKWTLSMVVREDQTLVGVQDLVGTEFNVTHEVGTGSWLGKAYQGVGIGKEMRAAILHLAFAGLGAERATSGAFEDNAASIAVSKSLGYVENGDDIKTPRGKPVRVIRLLLTREVWERHRRSDIRIHGLEPCLPMFGLDKKNA